MKITVSVLGRFWAFELAKQLNSRGYLDKIITSYPMFKVKEHDMPLDKVITVPSATILDQFCNKVIKKLSKTYNPQYLIHEYYDKRAANLIGKTDIVVGWSSSSLNTFRRAKKNGSICIVERGSSHMLYQQEIMKEEYAKYGLVFNETHPKIISKELREYEEADYITVPSQFVKNTFISKGIKEDKLICVPFGVDPNIFKQDKKQDNVFRVIFTGTMCLRKGVQYLLQAFHELKLPNSELLLAGGLTEQIIPFFKKYEGSFKWVGHKKQKELYKYYSQGSVFVMMSVEEGMALVQLQAMCCGLPLICTENTGGADLICQDKEGWVIPIRSVDKLKEKLLDLYENREKCSQMGINAKEKILNKFTWDHYGERITGEYKNIMEKKNEI